jgi:tripartite-type tricarboxylate transporter receptor subunit TctC
MARRNQVLLAAVLAATSTVASAQYPDRPLRLVIPFPGGGGPANVAGRVAQLMSAPLGQPVVLDNRPGANGVIGAELVIKSLPDGHTLFLGSATSMSALPHLRKIPPFDPLTAFSPIGMIGRSTTFLIVHPSLPAKTVAELIAYARANPGKLTYASGNTSGIVSMAQFMRGNNLDMVHVPYKGDVAAIGDFVAGRVQLMFASTSFASLMKEGRLRPLVAMLPERSRLLPDVPSMAEAGIRGINIRSWIGIVAAAKTPRAINARLNRELNRVLSGAEARALLDREGMLPEPMTIEQFAAHIKAQYEIWGQAIRDAGIPAE